MKPVCAVLARAVGLVRRGSNVDCLRGVEVSCLWCGAAPILLDFRNIWYIKRNLIKVFN